MGVKQKRTRYKEEFRRKILNAARELFINEGYEKFSMRGLAKKIDYSPTTIYLYFKDKNELLHAICEEVAEQFIKNLPKVHSGGYEKTVSLVNVFVFEFGYNI